jgi:hypothetical protein
MNINIKNTVLTALLLSLVGGIHLQAESPENEAYEYDLSERTYDQLDSMEKKQENVIVRAASIENPEEAYVILDFVIQSLYGKNLTYDEASKLSKLIARVGEKQCPHTYMLLSLIEKYTNLDDFYGSRNWSTSKGSAYYMIKEKDKAYYNEKFGLNNS